MAIDYSRQGQKIHISDDVPLQTIAYSVIDVLGHMIHFSQEARRYIQDSRRKKVWQRYVLNYFDRIPLILQDPSIVIVDPDDYTERTHLYYREIYVEELKRQILFSVVVRTNGEHVIYNFHPQETGRVKASKHKPPPQLLYLKPNARKKSYF